MLYQQPTMYLSLKLLFISTADCRNLYFKPSVQGKILRGHVIKSVPVLSEENCRVQCYLEERCISYNLSPQIDGFHTCNLSDVDGIFHAQDLEEMWGYTFAAAVVE